jgi:hypothetical protein
MIKKFLTLGLAILGIFTLTACTGDEGYTDEELLTMIQEAMDELDLLDTISTDLTLPNSGLNGVTITWESSDPDIIATDGTVTRPTKTERNKTVRLTATLTLEGQSLIKTFDITVLAEEDLNDAEKVAADTASLFVQEGAVYGDLTLPTSGPNGTTITWSSDKPDYISNTGEVTRPAIGEGDEVVTLTATITLNDESDTKVFEFRVIEDVLVMTINEIKTTAEEGDDVLVRALVLGHFKEGTYKGYFAYDGTGYIYIHLGSSAPTVEIGKVYQIAGEYDVYYGMPQIAYPTEQTELDTTMEWPAAIAVTIDDIMAYSTTVPKEKFSQYITLTGTVTYDGTYYYLTDEDGDSVELNDDSDIALVVAELGKSVTINAFYHSYHTGHGNHQISFSGDPAHLSVNELSDEEALAADVATIALPNAAAFDLTLPTTGINGTTFSNWASSNTAVYDNDGTFVAFGTNTVTITFTADAVNGTASETISVDVVVPVLSTIGDVLDFDKDDLFAVEGIVYSISYYGYHIYANGEYIFVNDTSYQDLLTLGDELLIVGYVGGFYHDMIQLKAYGYEIQSQGNVLPTYTAVDLSAAIAGEIEEGTPITITGEILVETGTYVDVYILDALGNQIQIHYNSNDNELESFDGQVVTIDVLVYTWDYLWFEGEAADVTVASFSDADKAAAILFDTIAGLGNLNGIATDLTLPTSYTDPAATIAWVSDDAGVITNDGVITIAYGSQATATLTVTVTVGTETASADVVVTLIDGNDLTPLSVTEVLAEEDGGTVIVTGVITGFSPYGDPFIQDADGTAIILEYFDAGELTVNVGDEIVAIGTLDTDTNYDERRLIDDAVLISVTSTGNTVFIIDDQLPAIGVEDNSLDITNKIYTMDLTVAAAPANASANPVIDTYGYVFFVGDGTTYFTMDAEEFAPYFADMYQVGDVLTITFIISDLYYNNLRIYPTVLPELTDAQKLEAAVGVLTLESSYTEDITLPATMDEYDATITWSSSDTAVITNDGVVTRPANGAGDATVTLTATIDVNGTSETKDFTITVPQEPSAAMTVTELWDANLSTWYQDYTDVFVNGVVAGFHDKGYLIQDPLTGEMIAVHDDTNTPTLGDAIAIEGEFNVSYDIARILNVGSFTVESSGNDINLDTTNAVTIDWANFDPANYIGLLVKVEGPWVKHYTGGTSYARLGDSAAGVDSASYDGKHVGLQNGANELNLTSTLADYFTGAATATEYPNLTLYIFFYDSSSSYNKAVIIADEHIVDTTPQTVTQIWDAGHSTWYQDYTTVYATGIVAGLHDKGYIIQDPVTAELIAVHDSTNTPAIGDEVTIEGEFNVSYDIARIVNVVAYELGTTGNAVNLDTTNAVTIDWANFDPANYIGLLVKVEGPFALVGSQPYEYARLGVDATGVETKAYDGKYIGLQNGANELNLTGTLSDYFTGAATATEYPNLTLYIFFYDSSSSYNKAVVIADDHIVDTTPAS